MTAVALMQSRFNRERTKEVMKERFLEMMLHCVYRESFMSDDFVTMLVMNHATPNLIEITREECPLVDELPTLNEVSSRGVNYFPQIIVNLSSFVDAPFYDRLVAFFERFVNVRMLDMRVFPIREFDSEEKIWNLGCNFLFFQ